MQAVGVEVGTETAVVVVVVAMQAGWRGCLYVPLLHHKRLVVELQGGGRHGWADERGLLLQARARLGQALAPRASCSARRLQHLVEVDELGVNFLEVL